MRAWLRLVLAAALWISLRFRGSGRRRLDADRSAHGRRPDAGARPVRARDALRRHVRRRSLPDGRRRRDVDALLRDPARLRRRRRRGRSVPAEDGLGRDAHGRRLPERRRRRDLEARARRRGPGVEGDRRRPEGSGVRRRGHDGTEARRAPLRRRRRDLEAQRSRLPAQLSPLRSRRRSRRPRRPSTRAPGATAYSSRPTRARPGPTPETTSSARSTSTRSRSIPSATRPCGRESGGEIYRSDDFGKSWAKKSTDQWRPFQGDAFAIDPTNPKIVYVGRPESCHQDDRPRPQLDRDREGLQLDQLRARSPWILPERSTPEPTGTGFSRRPTAAETWTPDARRLPRRRHQGPGRRPLRARARSTSERCRATSRRRPTAARRGRASTRA